MYVCIVCIFCELPGTRLGCKGCMYLSPCSAQPGKVALRVSVTKMSLQGVFETMAGQGDSDLVRQSHARGGRRPL